MATGGQGSQQLRPRSQYPTYDQLLEEGKVPCTPDPIAITRIDPFYQQYLRQSPAEQIANKDHQSYSQGKKYVYGTHKKGLWSEPIHGPAEWSLWIRRIEELGPFSHMIFEKRAEFETILTKNGYTLGEPIVIGAGGQYDNQVWKVSKGSVEYACKITHIRNFAQLSLQEAGYQVAKEGRLLITIKHPNIVKVVDNIQMDDSHSKFPLVFVATIMELLDGTLTHMLQGAPNFILPDSVLRNCFKDCAQAINYLHNEIRGPGGQWMRVVHMAIRPANILHKVQGIWGRTFKLADFEECIIYDRHFNPELWNSRDAQSIPPDVFPDPTRPPYFQQTSAPEIEAAIVGQVDRTNLRLMPNDVYCLGYSIAYCRCKDQTTNRGATVKVDILVLQVKEPEVPQMSLDHLILRATCKDPNQRATIADLLKHPFLTAR